MARTNTSSRFALPPFFLVSNVIIWISAVIVMGIVSYFISEGAYVGNHIIYEEVIVSPIHNYAPCFESARLLTHAYTVRPHRRLLPHLLHPWNVPRLHPLIQYHLLVPLARRCRVRGRGLELRLR